MTEILFYHLETRPLDSVLPALLEKSLERGWRAVVECGGSERMEALDATLWTFRDDSFLPHGVESGTDTDRDQPILLTTSAQANGNAAQIRFFVDRAVPREGGTYERIVFLFDGHDEEAVAAARAAWRALREAGHDLTYWQQDANGRWAKKA